MADKPGKQQPDLTERAQAAQRERQQRLAGALRANLRRRRAPARLDSDERPSDTSGEDRGEDKDNG